MTIFSSKIPHEFAEVRTRRQFVHQKVHFALDPAPGRRSPSDGPRNRPPRPESRQPPAGHIRTRRTCFGDQRLRLLSGGPL